MLGDMRKTLLLVVVSVLLRQSGAQQADYAALLDRCSKHEKEAMKHEQHFQFLEREQSESSSETRTVIETSEGRVDRMIAFNDQPLAPDQQTKQQQRLTKLLNDPEALRDEVSQQRDETRRRELMVATLPEAFILDFSGVEPDGRLRFVFTPNPKFAAKDRETQIFKGMRGSLWIDPQYERIAEVHGTLFKDVNFGWGILGRLHKGGHFEVVQSQVSPGVWRITSLNVNFTGRVLLFLPLRIFRQEHSSGYVAMPQQVSAHVGITQLLSQHADGAQAQDNDRHDANIRKNRQ